MSDRTLAIAASSGRVFDFIANNKNEKYCRIDYSDKTYEWTTNDILYVELYDMAINEDFIKRILEVKAPKKRTISPKGKANAEF